jgi:hypothetical protein
MQQGMSEQLGLATSYETVDTLPWGLYTGSWVVPPVVTE